MAEVYDPETEGQTRDSGPASGTRSQHTRKNLSDSRRGGSKAPADASDLRQAEEDNLYNPNGDNPGGEGKSGSSGSDIKSKEESPNKSSEDDDDGGLWNDSSNSGKTQKTGRFRFTKQKMAIGGSLAGVAVGGIFGALTIVQGPFQLIHIAQILEKAHFTNQEDASDGRMGKLYRFVTKGNSPGETRLTWLESKYNANIITQLEERGFKPDFDKSTGELRGFTVDPEAKKSPYAGQSNEDIVKSLDAKGIPAEVVDGKVYSKAKGYRNQNRASKFFVKQLGESRIANAERVRVFKKYGWVSWHPLQKADKKAGEAPAKLYEKWKKAREDRLKNGAKGVSIDGTGTKEVDADGNEIDVGGETDTPDADKVKETLNKIKASRSLRAAGGLAAATGLVCAAKTVNDNIGMVRYAQVISPLLRLGSDAVTIGNQAMSNQDIDMTTAGYVSKSFVEKDSKGKSVLSTWSQAKSLRAEQGQEGGADIDGTTKDMITEGSPAWLAWTANSVVGSLCGTAGQIVTGAVSVTITVLSGGIVSGVGGVVGGALVGDQVVNRLTDLLSGNAVNVAASGAKWGNYINYGTRLFGNSMALSSGGTKLATSQVAALDADRDADSAQEFQSQSLVSRVFNAYDSRSLVSKVIDEVPDQSPASNMASAFQSGPSIFSSIMKSAASLFTPKVHAATAYDYGFPEIGFSKEDLGSSIVADPYKNAELAAKLFDKNGQAGTPDYIARAQKCFGIEIKKDSNDKWGSFPLEDVQEVYAKVYDKTSDYDQSGCTDSGNDDWLRVRFFVFDSGLMDGWACVEGDDDSCSTVGADVGSGASNGAPTDLTPTVEGSSQELAQKILDLSDSGKLKIQDYSEDKASDSAARSLASQQIADIAAGKQASSSTRCSYSVPKTVEPDERILEFLVDLAGQTNYTINVLFGQCHSGPGSNHHQGKAVDFGCPLDTATADKVGRKYGISHNDEACGGKNNHWHYSVGGN